MNNQKKRVYLFDTTLRDGAQTSGVDFSVEDKNRIARALDDFGIDYIEGGWPGANPTDDQFFGTPPEMKNSCFTAFGMTKKNGVSAANDPSLSAVINAGTPAVCIVGKSWDFHVDVALGIPRDDNLTNISESIGEICASDTAKEAMLDAEHFFDGYKANPEYALECLKSAHDAGARWIVLCDTNGGTLPHEIDKIVREVAQHIPSEKLGIHTHDDTGNAVANSIAAINAGCAMVQGTLNGLGERCGNANLITLMPILSLKMGLDIGKASDNLAELKSLSLLLDEILNRSPQDNAPFIGRRAFAHKGGLHVSAIAKDPASYEHINPELVGNTRDILVSDQAGRSNILARLKDIGLEDTDKKVVDKLIRTLKQKEAEGYSYDTAPASFEVLARRALGHVSDYFEVIRFSVKDERRYNAKGLLITASEAVVKIRIGAEEYHTVAEGNGPIHAIDLALRKALEPAYPVLKHISLQDFRVRILKQQDASAAMPRVKIESAGLVAGQHRYFTTIGVSTNIIEASFNALGDSFVWTLLKSDAKAVN